MPNFQAKMHQNRLIMFIRVDSINHWPMKVQHL